MLPDGRCVSEDIWQCTHCGGTMIEFADYAHSHEPGTVGDVEPLSIRLAVPERAPRELDVAVPETVRSLFREASVVEQCGALRAAGVMYRAAVEQLCKERGVPGNNLFDRIAALGTLGVDQEIIDASHEARLLGNWSIHDGIEFAADEVADVAELVVEAVNVLYVEPGRRDQMREARRRRRDGRAGEPAAAGPSDE